MNLEEFKKLTPEKRRDLELAEKTPNEQVVFEQLKKEFGIEMQQELENFKNEDKKIDQITESVGLENIEAASNVKDSLGIHKELEKLNDEASKLIQKTKQDVGNIEVLNRKLQEKFNDIMVRSLELEKFRSQINGNKNYDNFYSESDTATLLQGLSEGAGIFQKIQDRNLNLDEFTDLAKSTNPEDQLFFNQMNAEFEEKVPNSFNFSDVDPVIVLDKIKNESMLLKGSVIKELINKQKDSLPINIIFDFLDKNKSLINEDILKEISYLMDNQKDSVLAKSGLPLDQMIEIYRNDPDFKTIGFRTKKLIEEQSKPLLEYYAADILGTSSSKLSPTIPLNDIPGIVKIEYIDSLLHTSVISPEQTNQLVKTFDIKPEGLSPRSLNFLFRTSAFFDYLPNAEKLNSFKKVLDSGIYISPTEVDEELQDVLKDSFIEAAHKSFDNGDLRFLADTDIRKQVLTTLENKGDTKNIKNIQESFYVVDSPEKLPEPILKMLEKFEDQYGSKGKDLIALAVFTYGMEHPENFVKQMESIEQVLNKYNPDAIPEGAKVSMGVEYEVTLSLANIYADGSDFGYIKDIEMVSRSANIGKGNDAVHEIALKPNYNPYMMLAEMKLLQEAGFLDLNFERYPDAARGYHLSLVGDNGLEVNSNMFFLNNVLTMAQLTGITAGKEVSNTKHIHSKSFEHFSDSEQRGHRCEMKGMSTDSVEQFEKAVITSHHAGIAIQVTQKYFEAKLWPDAQEILKKIPSDKNEFERAMLSEMTKPFESDQDRDIAYEWMHFQASIMKGVEQHNESFMDSEFNGFVLDNEGNYIDTGSHIDVMRNKKLIESSNQEQVLQKTKIWTNELFESQSPIFVNALANINNIFLKPPQADDNSPVNAKAVLDTVRKENYGGIVDGKFQESIFDNQGEYRDGYYYVQGASEEMIIHKTQILLNRFNKNMEELLSIKSVERNQDQVNANFSN